MLLRCVLRCLLLWGLMATVVTPVQGQVTAEAVREAIDRGVAYLKSQQNKTQGSWAEHTGQPGGASALCTLALINCGVPLDDPALQQALAYVRQPKAPQRTYSVSLQTMVLCAAAPEQERLQIRENVAWLQQTQINSGTSNGAWWYGDARTGGDPSNTQFAMLALYEAERVGVEVQEATWRRALGYWTRQQRSDGSWSYNPEMPPSGSMTCAGIASTIIALGQLSESDATVTDGQVQCCAPQQDNQIVQRGLEWLAKNFTVTSNPSPTVSRDRTFSKAWLLYYLYGLERVGRLSGQRFIGDHDWYREGVEVLLKQQDRVAGYWRGVGIERDPQISTALALLFLSKGRRPVLISKLTHDEGTDWNRHRHDLAHLTQDVERRWKRDMTWQTIHGDRASVRDLLETPVLYISGRDQLRLGEEQKRSLREYVEQGGFVFVEACCQGDGFDRDFRQLMTELFPDSPLRLMPPDHPIWFAEEQVPAEFVRPLYGIDSCCRTAVVYCPGELSCYWELADMRRLKELPDRLQQEIRAVLAIGANVLTYATNRQLKEKLEPTELIAAPADQGPQQRGTLYVAKLSHGGGSDDAPSALVNLLRLAGEQLKVRVSQEKRMLAATDASLPDYPIVFLHGRRNFRLSAAERTALQHYVAQGGFVMADSICASPAFSDALRQELQAIFPEHPLQPIAPGHPLLTSAFQGYNLETVQLREPRPRTESDQPLQTRVSQVSPVLEGIEIDGRLAVVFSPFDLSCALENQASIECKGYPREDAAKIGINILLYAMQQ